MMRRAISVGDGVDGGSCSDIRSPSSARVRIILVRITVGRHPMADANGVGGGLSGPVGVGGTA